MSRTSGRRAASATRWAAERWWRTGGRARRRRRRTIRCWSTEDDISGGHYTAYNKNLDNAQWYSLDDSRVVGAAGVKHGTSHYADKSKMGCYE